MGLMSLDPKVQCVLDAQAEIGEAPWWDPQASLLYWSDIPRGELHAFDPASGQDQCWSFDEPLGSFAVCRDGGFLLALGQGFSRYDPGTGTLTPIVSLENEPEGNRMNDGATDPAGRFWAGTMAISDYRSNPSGSLYRLDCDGKVSCLTSGLYIQNGLAFSPDGCRMYLSDTAPQIQSIWVFDYEIETGAAANRRLFADTRDLAGRPDGAAVDSDGCYWVAGAGGWQVIRFTPRGELDRIIDVPVEKPTNLAFGGSDLSELYVTSIGPQGCTPGTVERQPHAGGLFRITGHGATGLPQTPFQANGSI